MSKAASRTAFSALLLIALLLFWQATQLDSWGMFGPGEGLFPMLATGACCIFAALLQLLPFAASVPSEGSEEEAGPEERRTFRFYTTAMILLPVASFWLGFILTALLLVLMLSWGAERRSWRGALVFGVLCGLVGVIGFGDLLGASLPTSELDLAVLRLLR